MKNKNNIILSEQSAGLSLFNGSKPEWKEILNNKFPRWNKYDTIEFSSDFQVGGNI